MLYAKEDGKPSEPTAFVNPVRTAVREVAEQQVAVGVDVVSDGEVGKASFVSYVKDQCC